MLTSPVNTQLNTKLTIPNSPRGKPAFSLRPPSPRLMNMSRRIIVKITRHCQLHQTRRACPHVGSTGLTDVGFAITGLVLTELMASFLLLGAAGCVMPSVQDSQLLHGPVAKHGFAVNVAALDGAELAAVVGCATVVAEHEIRILRNYRL